MRNYDWMLLAAVMLWLVMSATTIIILAIVFGALLGEVGKIVGFVVGMTLVAIYVVHIIKEK